MPMTYTTETNGRGDLKAARAHQTTVRRMAVAAERRAERIALAEDDGCREDYCFVCRRCTDHRGEHSEAQLLAYFRAHFL